MRLLLDTHALLWSLSHSARIEEQAREAIQDGDNAVFVSAASVWEIAIKRAIGKLEVPEGITEQLRLNAFEPLPVTLDHAWVAGSLPLLHRDPFDRMLVAQARAEQLTLVTRDPQVQQYNVQWMAC